MSNWQEVSFEYTADEKVSLIELYQKESWTMNLIMVLGLLIMTFGGPIYLILRAREQWLATLVSLSPCFVGPTLLILFTSRILWSTGTMTRKLDGCQSLIFVIEDGGFHVFSRPCEWLLYWWFIERILMSEDFVSITYGKDWKCFDIPLRAFSSEAHRDNFIEELERRSGKVRSQR